MTISTISSKGWIVIPAELRKKHDLHPGARVAIVDYGGVLAVVPAHDEPVEQSAGMLKGTPSLVDALRQERSLERQREG